MCGQRTSTTACAGRSPTATRPLCARSARPRASSLVCGAPEKPARSEEEARKQRYAFLDSIPCDAVAIAHTAEDNLETLLQHLLRGSGLRGLGGIPPRRGRYVRPLLAVSHAQAREYLRARGTGWREDATNAEDGCQRNRLRHGVLPLLAAETPELPLRVTELTALVRADDALLDREAERLLLPAPEPLFSDPCVLRRCGSRRCARPRSRCSAGAALPAA